MTPSISTSLPLPCVAFFDSGQGGLTVWEEVCTRFPMLNTLYLADNARYPFGNKGAETVTRYTAEAAYFCAERNAQLLVVACGTASSVAVEKLRDVYRFPIVGIVEGFCRETQSLLEKESLRGSVAVLGTRYTVSSGRFQRELSKYGIDQVWQKACPLFVPLVEEGIVSGPMIDSLCQLYLDDMPQDVSVIMLACTHFPRLAESIALFFSRKTGRKVVSLRASGQSVLANGNGSPLYLMDSGLGIVESVGQFLKGSASPESFQGGVRSVYCTDAPERFLDVASAFTKQELPQPQRANLGI